MSTVSVTKVINASPHQLYALVSDLPRMGEWSPENEGGTWIKGATGPAVGAAFQGRNAHDGHRWSTVAKVTEADPGRRFAFRVTVGPIQVADWSYDFEAVDGGCRVTETWTDRRNAIAAFLGGVASKVKDRAAHNRVGMEKTLENLAATVTA